MKFQVREGYVVRFTRRIDIEGADKPEFQEVTAYAGQTIDLSAEEAEQHAHKLEPKDKASEAQLAAKVMPQSSSASLGLSAEQLALVQAMAQAMAQQILGAQAPAQKPAA